MTFLHLAAAPDLVLHNISSEQSLKSFLEGVSTLPQYTSILEELHDEQLPEYVLEILQDVSLVNALHPRLGTALHIAVENGDPQVAAMLLEFGADCGIKKQHKLTPLESFKQAYAKVSCEGRHASQFRLFNEEISLILEE
jgi:ankyrin repeat protein